MGVNFIVAPRPDLSKGRHLEFQRRLAEENVEFDQVLRNQGQLVFVRGGPKILRVQLGELPNQAPVGQLLIIEDANMEVGSVDSGVSLEMFAADADTICDVFQEVWPEGRQILSRDAAVHELHDSGAEHAFTFLWETRLRQPEESLRKWGRSVLGGGLRFVMPPMEDEADPKMVEVKIESFLRDPSKVYLDAIMQWPRPAAEGLMEPRMLVDEVCGFVRERVIPFVKG